MGAEFFLNYYAIPVFIACIISAVISYLSFIRDNKHGEGYFGWLMISCAIYAFFYGMELSVQSFEWMKFFIKLEYLGAAFLAPFLLLFSLKFGGHINFIKSQLSYTLFIIPIFTLIVVMTNDIHNSYHKGLQMVYNGHFFVLDFESGWLYWIHQFYAVVSVVISNVIFIKLLVHNKSIISNQVIVMLLGTLAAWSAHLAYIFGLMPLNIDPVPFAFSLSGIIIYIGFVKFKLFSITPVAFKTLFERLPEGVMVFDQEDKLVQCNRAAYIYLNLNEKIIGQSRGTVLQEWPQIIDITNTNDKEIEIWKSTPSSQNKIWYRVIETSLQDKKGGHIGSMLNVREITRTKIESQVTRKREQLLRITSEISQQLLHKQELDSILSLFWPNLCHLLRADNLSLHQFEVNTTAPITKTVLTHSALKNKTDKTIPDGVKRQIKTLNGPIIHNSKQPTTYKLLHEYAREGELVYLLIIPIRLDNHCWGFIYLDSKINAHLLNYDEIAILQSLSDILGASIQRHLLEEELKNIAQKAMAALTAKSDFLANMSHEIRTPLNGIIGFSDLLYNTPLDKQQKEYLEIVQSSSNSLLSLINDILDFSKIEAGKIEITEEKVNLRELINNTVDIVSIKYKKEQVNTIIEIAPSTPSIVFTDPLRLQQILTNLISNAFKFTEKGYVKIRVKLNLTSPSTGVFLFEVEDTGKGIAKTNQQKVIRPFEQEDHSITKKYGGTGLGLSITQKLLNLMDSELQFESELDKGSRFFFSISLSFPESKTDKDFDKKLKDELPLTTEQLFNPYILIVEDDNLSQKLLQHLIKPFTKDSTVLKTDSAEEALMLYRKFNPALVFVDNQLPGSMDGSSLIKVFRAISQMAKNEPFVILMSSFLNEQEQSYAINCGANALLNKPVDEAALKKVFNY